MAIKNTTVSQTFPFFRSLVFPTVTRTLKTIGVATTITAAELLTGLLWVDCTDPATATLPTADLLADALPAGVGVGQGFYVDIKNVGDSLLTIAAGAGGAGAGTLTIATLTTRRFFVSVTALKQDGDPASSNTYDLYSIGTLAA